MTLKLGLIGYGAIGKHVEAADRGAAQDVERADAGRGQDQAAAVGLGRGQ